MTERSTGIGIDLGTANSAICRLDTSTGVYQFAHAFDTAGERDIPSAVFIDTDGHWYFGETAEHRGQSVAEAGRVISNFKLLLRDNAPIEVPGVGAVDPVDLTRRFVGYLQQCYESHFHEPCVRAVVTVPANASFDADYRERLQQALQGGPQGPLFESFATLAEPDAVLMSMIDLSELHERTVLVFDMGGGTLDVTIRRVEMEGDRPILHHASVVGSDAAGVQVTRALTDHLLDRWEQNGKFSFTKDERLAAHRVNHFSIDTYKRHLSGLTRQGQGGLESARPLNCRVNAVGRGEGHYSENVPAKLLTDLSRPTCERAIETVENALREAGLIANDVDHYFVVGGSSRLPLMEKMLRDVFGGRGPSGQMGKYGHIDPLLAVSKGAAVDDFDRAEVAQGGGHVPSTIPILERRLPYAVSLVVDRTSLECLVQAGAALPFGPVSKTLYMPADDDNLDIIMMRGDGALEECVPMTHRTVYFDRRMRRGEELRVSWFVSDDGQVTVSIMGDDGQAVEAVTADRLEAPAA